MMPYPARRGTCSAATATTGLGEGMARLVRGPDWARMGTNKAEMPEDQNSAAAIEIEEKVA
jgi:hypothetical protein